MEEFTLIELKKIKVFHRKNLVINGADLKVSKGEFVYLIGKTGSGKSSILKALYKEVDIAEGSGNIIDFDLVKIKKRQIPKLRKQLGIVFQDFQLLPDRSVIENLIFVMKATGWKDSKAMNDHAKLILEQVNLAGIENKFPHQLS